MALILKGGAIFLHIPKTGGNWVTKVLNESNLIDGFLNGKHIDMNHLYSPVTGSRGNLLQYYLKQKLKFSDRKCPFMFCFVRHPLSWYESWFKYMSQPSRQWRYWGNEKDLTKWHPNTMLNNVGDPDFNQFMRNAIKKRPGYVTELFGWYTQTRIDFVGKQENLNEDLIRVLKILKLDFDEDLIRNYNPVGVSKKPKRKIVWDADLKEEVRRLEYAGIVRYGYN